MRMRCERGRRRLSLFSVFNVCVLGSLFLVLHLVFGHLDLAFWTWILRSPPSLSRSFASPSSLHTYTPLNIRYCTVPYKLAVIKRRPPSLFFVLCSRKAVPLAAILFIRRLTSLGHNLLSFIVRLRATMRCLSFCLGLDRAPSALPPVRSFRTLL